MRGRGCKKRGVWRNLMGLVLALMVVVLTIFSTMRLLEQEEKNRMGRLERATGKEVSLFQPGPSSMTLEGKEADYQMLVDRLLCLGNVQQEVVREPRQDEFTMEEAYTHCIEELQRMTDLGVEFTNRDFSEFALQGAELVSIYNETYGESAWWLIHLSDQNDETGDSASMDVQLDAMTGKICQIYLEQNTPFKRKGTLEDTTLAYQTYLGILEEFAGEVEIQESADRTIQNSWLYTLDGRLIIAMQDYLIDSEGHGFFLWVRSA